MADKAPQSGVVLTERALERLLREDLHFRKTVQRILGRIGGEKGGIKTAQGMTPEQRMTRARKAAAARWGPVTVVEFKP